MAYSLDTLSAAKTYRGAYWQSGDVTNSPTQITCHLLKWIISVLDHAESQGHTIIRLDHLVNGSVLSWILSNSIFSVVTRGSKCSSFLFWPFTGPTGNCYRLSI